MKRWSGADIRELRKRFKLSQRFLAKLMGTTTQCVYLWEKNKRTPSKMAMILFSSLESELEAIWREAERG